MSQVAVDHLTVNRWAIRFLPLIEKLSRKHKRMADTSWRMDETYIKVRDVAVVQTCSSARMTSFAQHA